MPVLPIIRGLVFVGWAVWLLVYWHGGSRIVADIHRALHTPRTRLDALLLISITIDSLVVLATGLLALLEIVKISPAFDQLSLVGAVLALAGIWGTFSARQHLGQAWTAQTRVADGQELVEHGPYSIVRHPIYSAAILMYIGLALVFPVWWNGLAILSIVFGYVLKTYDEDCYLKTSLRGYGEYARRVRYRLVPWIW